MHQFQPLVEFEKGWNVTKDDILLSDQNPWELRHMVHCWNVVLNRGTSNRNHTHYSLRHTATTTPPHQHRPHPLFSETHRKNHTPHQQRLHPLLSETHSKGYTPTLRSTSVTTPSFTEMLHLDHNPCSMNGHVTVKNSPPR